MTKLRLFGLIGILILSATPNSAFALCATPPTLNGTFRGNDGGTYYIRQVGSDVWWFGRSADQPPTFANVFKGVRNGNTITGAWSDVPLGRTRGAGTMTLNVVNNADLRRTAVTGGFGGSRFFIPCEDVILNPQ